MTISELQDLVNSHLPDTFSKSKYHVIEADDGIQYLGNENGNMNIHVDLLNRKVVGALMMARGVPFLGISPTEMLEHTAETLVVAAALIQAFTDPENTEDYSKTKSILTILGLLSSEKTGSMNKSYYKDGIHYTSKASNSLGVLTLSIRPKDLTI